MLAVTKLKVLQTGRTHLVLERFPCAIRSFAYRGKSKRLEGQGIFIDLFIHVDRARNSSNMGTLGDECTVRKSEIRHGLAPHRNWKCKLAKRLLRTGRSSLVDPPRILTASRRKLSNLRILKIDALVQPCSLTIDSTSSRRGSMHSGLVHNVRTRHSYQSMHDLLSQQLVQSKLERLCGNVKRQLNISRRKQLTLEVVWIAAKLTTSIRSVRLRGSFSSPTASSISHDNMSVGRSSGGSRYLSSIIGTRSRSAFL